MKLTIQRGKKKLNTGLCSKIVAFHIDKVSAEQKFLIHTGVFRNNQPLLRFPYICAV